jgi:hypothetical protein
MAQQGALKLGPDRFLIGIVAGAVVLIAVSVMVVLSQRQPSALPTHDPESPAGVVEAYIAAVRAGDDTGARGLLSVAARRTPSARDLPRTVATNDQNVRIVIDSVSENETKATVQLTVSRFYTGRGPLFAPNTDRRRETVRLIREDGAWRIDDVTGAYVFR